MIMVRFVFNIMFSRWCWCSGWTGGPSLVSRPWVTAFPFPSDQFVLRLLMFSPKQKTPGTIYIHTYICQRKGVLMRGWCEVWQHCFIQTLEKVLLKWATWLVVGNFPISAAHFSWTGSAEYVMIWLSVWIITFTLASWSRFMVIEVSLVCTFSVLLGRRGGWYFFGERSFPRRGTLQEQANPSKSFCLPLRLSWAILVIETYVLKPAQLHGVFAVKVALQRLKQLFSTSTDRWSWTPVVCFAVRRLTSKILTQLFVWLNPPFFLEKFGWKDDMVVAGLSPIKSRGISNLLTVLIWIYSST